MLQRGWNCKGVVDSVCILDGRSEIKRLTLFYISIYNEKITDNVIRNYLITKLPSYMIPSSYIQVESFSTLPNGKIDKIKMLSRIIPVKKGPISSFMSEVEEYLYKS